MTVRVGINGFGRIGMLAAACSAAPLKQAAVYRPKWKSMDCGAGRTGWSFTSCAKSPG